jgi:hypothetical protein
LADRSGPWPALRPRGAGERNASDSTAELESSCDDDHNMLDTCAAFQETFAKATAALGPAKEAAGRFEHGAALRACIAALKGSSKQ